MVALQGSLWRLGFVVLLFCFVVVAGLWGRGWLWRAWCTRIARSRRGEQNIPQAPPSKPTTQRSSGANRANCEICRSSNLRPTYRNSLGRMDLSMGFLFHEISRSYRALSSIGPQDDAHAAARALGIQDFYCKWHDVFLRGAAARAPLLREVQLASGGGCSFGGRGAHGPLDLAEESNARRRRRLGAGPAGVVPCYVVVPWVSWGSAGFSSFIRHTTTSVPAQPPRSYRQMPGLRYYGW